MNCPRKLVIGIGGFLRFRNPHLDDFLSFRIFHALDFAGDSFSFGDSTELRGVEPE